jgi:two-component system sensor histidine kinase KdpD
MSNSSPTKGRLKVFLGYAAGVGKTYQMLEEAQELKRTATDVVVGYFEPHARPDTIALMKGLETVPVRVVEYRGTRFDEMDSEAIVRRHPQVAVVDEFPHTNVPGSARAKRWEDVLYILDQGIHVLTTMNVQHLESMNDQVYNMTGVRVRETVPDWVVQQAAEVVMVDLTPRALLNRLDRGVVYQGDKIARAKENFFKESTLVALRELALRETAFEVESRSNPLMQAQDDGVTTVALSENAGRVLVYLTPEPSSAALIRRGKRVADYMKTECLAVTVCPDNNLDERLQKHLSFAEHLHLQTHILPGTDVADTLVNFARQHGVTQIYLARPRTARLDLPFTRDLVQRVARLARDMEVTIVAERSR